MAHKVKAVAQFKNGEVYEWDTIWERALKAGECLKVTGKDAQALIDAYRQGQLLALIKPKDTVYTIQVKDTGMTQHFQVLIPSVSPEGRTYIRDITSMVADLCGHTLKNGAIPMGGYGYSKGFQIVYGLGLALWPNGTPEPHGMRNGEPDSNGGYALGQQGL